MASNERENARRERARQKDKKTKIIVWSILAVIIVVLLAMRVSEIDFKAIKNKYTDQNGKFTLSMTTDADAYPFQLDSSSGVDIKNINDKLSILTSSSLTVINPSNAQRLYSYDHGYANPMISYSGNYICLFDQGGTRLRLDSFSDNLYEQSMQKSILTADVASNGTVIYATQSDNAKSSVFVINKSLKELMTFDVKDGYVVDVAIDSSGKKCAYVTINSENAVLKTTLHTINVGDNKDIKTFTYDNTNILDLRYNSSSLYVVGDNMVSVISSQKKEKVAFKHNSINTLFYTYTKNNELIIDYTDYAGASENTISYVKENGKVKTSIKLDKRIKYLSTSSNEITALFSDKIVTYSLSKGKEKSSIICDDSVNSADTLSSKTFVQIGQQLDVIN